MAPVSPPPSIPDFSPKERADIWAKVEAGFERGFQFQVALIGDCRLQVNLTPKLFQSLLTQPETVPTEYGPFFNRDGWARLAYGASFLAYSIYSRWGELNREAPIDPKLCLVLECDCLGWDSEGWEPAPPIKALHRGLKYRKPVYEFPLA